MNDRLLKVEGHPHLVRDAQTNAILNTDFQGHSSYISLRNAKKKEINRITSLECDINNIKSDLNDLKSDLSEIKTLLGKIANGS